MLTSPKINNVTHWRTGERTKAQFATAKIGELDEEASRVAREAEAAMLTGRVAVIYTSRQLVAPEQFSPEEKLEFSANISKAVSSAVARSQVRPAFIIAKGGITSSDIGTDGLGVKKARVLGQIAPGIPVWLTGDESKFPGMKYIIFPGNVGEPTTLKDMVRNLTFAN